jgi:hypothetical protein
MDQDSSCVSTTSHNSFRHTNKDRRLRNDRYEKYPNGYIEEWNNPKHFVNEYNDKRSKTSSIPHTNTKFSCSKCSNEVPNFGEKLSYTHDNKHKQKNPSITDKRYINKNKQPPKISLSNSYLESESIDFEDSEMILRNYIPKSKRELTSKFLLEKAENISIESGNIAKSSIPSSSTVDNQLGVNQPLRSDELSPPNNTSERKYSPSGFSPVSIILSTQENLLLNNENNYEISFNTGMLEGNGISINETGNVITFKDDGSYRFEISGEAILFSDVDVSLTYYSDKFATDVQPFSISKIPKNESKLQLRGIPTILPLQKNQTIVTKLIPTPDESIVLMGGTRLLIHKVA